ncbi:hypothetical protein AB0D11_45400 [Streptomyces monashensis]|uniref:hypothetical protein n=1 Tax=Streptomyces monashensis TaxID=1678012 RepID=UPI0033CFA454
MDQISASGLHNAYDKSKCKSITAGPDLGAHLLEIDAYSTYGNPGGWIVSHSDPLINNNNRTYTTGSGVFKTARENGSLRTCLDDLKAWSDAHPRHDPVYIKKAGAWPTWNQLRGKFIVFPITGTIENKLAAYKLDNLSTEQEYAQHLADLSAAGRLEEASMWPAMTKPSPNGDPRLIYDAELRPWFVVFEPRPLAG